MYVYLRLRNQIKSGMISHYYEIYKGTITLPESWSKILRKYEYLKLYLKANPTASDDKHSNKDTFGLAKVSRLKENLK